MRGEGFMSNFRVGDVVRHYVNVYVVADVRGSEVDVHLPVGGLGNTHANNITLLRRPVAVGDVLVDRMGEAKLTVLRVEFGGHGIVDSTDQRRLFLTRAALDRWTHEDGTPIEPPRPEQATVRPKPDPDDMEWRRTGSQCDLCHDLFLEPNVPAHACRNALAFPVLSKPTDSYNPPERAALLADRCQVLEDETRKLKCELADALRNVARLERRGRR
jgi:hypothetical protein